MNTEDAINHFGSPDCLYRFDGSRGELEEFMSSLGVSYSYFLGDGCFVRTELPVTHARLVPVQGVY